MSVQIHEDANRVKDVIYHINNYNLYKWSQNHLRTTNNPGPQPENVTDKQQQNNKTFFSNQVSPNVPFTGLTLTQQKYQGETHISHQFYSTNFQDDTIKLYDIYTTQQNFQDETYIKPHVTNSTQ